MISGPPPKFHGARDILYRSPGIDLGGILLIILLILLLT